MALATSRNLLGIIKYPELRYLYRKSQSFLRWNSSYRHQLDENAAKLKANKETRINMSEDELKWMFDNKIYNSETWALVIGHKKTEENKRRNYWKTAITNSGEKILSSDPDRNLSVAARMLLESSTYKASNSSEITKRNSYENDTLATESELNSFPFAFSDIEIRRDKLLKQKLSKSSFENILQETVAPNTLPDVPSTFSTDKLNCKSIVNAKVNYKSALNDANKEKPRWKMFYGTPNPDVPITKTPCGGCGAHLHCQNSAIAGYVPSEILIRMSELELQDMICQRCSFLKEYNIALNLSVPPQTYPEIIAKIKEQNALIVLMVDLLDFPCSIWPGIIDLVGPKQPILIVGNKIDLLPKDGHKYLDRVKSVLRGNLKELGVDSGKNIKKVCLVSAKTGYGVEELINAIHANWGMNGDIYLIGCTNVGKSTLFNALLQSDLCKVQAMDLIQRATISIWPGTTLNLLKFPVLRPSAWRQVLRDKRLKSWNYMLSQERMLRKQKLKETNDPQFATLIGHVGLTFNTDNVAEDVDASKDAFKLAVGSNADVPKRRLCKFDPNDYEYRSGKWLYDTPGSIHKDQIITLLTMEELSLTLPNRYAPPRCYVIKPGHTLFLAGLGRLDYTEGTQSISTMLFSSPQLPISIMKTEFADEFYRKYLGTEIMKVPMGDFKRLKDFPALVPKEFKIVGEGKRHCSADILFSSAGWISLVLDTELECKFLAYTPDGRGCHIRQPALLKYAIRMRAKRLVGTPACHPSKVSIEED